MRFEWDEAKRLSNLEKHGIDFQDATHLFRAPHLKRRDERKPYGEERWQAIGMVGDKVFFVVYTLRQKVVRIISARLANEKEKQIFLAAL